MNRFEYLPRQFVIRAQRAMDTLDISLLNEKVIEKQFRDEVIRDRCWRFGLDLQPPKELDAPRSVSTLLSKRNVHEDLPAIIGDVFAASIPLARRICLCGHAPAKISEELPYPRNWNSKDTG